MSWFQCATCWKVFHLRIQLAMHLKKSHSELGFVNSIVESAENERDRAKTSDRDEGEKVKKTRESMEASCRAGSAFICPFDCNKQFTDLQMWYPHSLKAHNSEISQPRKAFSSNQTRQLSSQQTIKSSSKEIPVHDISSSEDESTMPANANSERRTEVEEEVVVTSCESLGNRNKSTVNLVQQRQSQSNHQRISSQFTNRKKKENMFASNGLRQGMILLRKRRPRRCPYCSKKFLLSVDNYRHIKAVHGKLLARNDSDLNSSESRKCLIDTAEMAVISSLPTNRPSDIRPHVSSDSEYSIQGYKCKFCLQTFRRLAALKSHFKVSHEYIRPFIPSFVLKHQQSEQLSLLSRCPIEGNISLAVDKVQNSFESALRSGTGNNNSSDSQEVESKTNGSQSSVLLEGEANEARTDTRPKSIKINNNPPLQLEASKMKLKYKCPSCPKLYSRRALRDDHLTVHSGQRRYKCPLCGRRIRYRYDLTRHMKKLHGHPNYNIEEAVADNVDEGASTQESQESRMDVAERSSGVRFACAICGKTFSLRVQLLHHTKRNHGSHRDHLHDFTQLEKPTGKDPLVDALPTTPPSERESSTWTPYCLRPNLHGSLHNSGERQTIDPKREFVTTRGRFTCCLCPEEFTLLPDWFTHYEQSHLMESSPCAATQKLAASIDQPPTLAPSSPRDHQVNTSTNSLKYPDAGHLSRMRCFLGTLRKELLEAVKTVESTKLNGSSIEDNATNLTFEKNCQNYQPQITSSNEDCVTIPGKNSVLRCPQCPLTFGLRSALLRHIDRVNSGKDKKSTLGIKKVNKSSSPPKVDECSTLQEDKGQRAVNKSSIKQLKRLIGNGHKDHDNSHIESTTSEDNKDEKHRHLTNTSSGISQSVSNLKEGMQDSLASLKTDNRFSHHTDNIISEHSFASLHATPPNESEPLCHWEQDHSYYQLAHRCNTEFNMDKLDNNPTRTNLEHNTSPTFYPKRCKYCPKWLFSSETFASHLQIHANLPISFPHSPLKFQSILHLESSIKSIDDPPSEDDITSDNDVNHQLGEALRESSPVDATCDVKTNSKRPPQPRQPERSLSPENLERIGNVRQKIHKKQNAAKCHVVQELVEAEFECEKCGKLIPTRQALINHRRVHKASDETTFCPYCSRSFRYRKNFRCHMLIMHDEMTPDLDKNHVLSPRTRQVEGRPRTRNRARACKTEKRKETKLVNSDDDQWNGTSSISEADECDRETSSEAVESRAEKPNEVKACKTKKSWKPGQSHKKKPCKTDEKWKNKKKVLALPTKLRSSKEDDIKVSMKCISKRKSSTGASKFEQLVRKCDNPYVCLMCDSPFRRFEALKMHLKNLHQLGNEQADGLASVIQSQHDLVVESELAKEESTIDEDLW